MNSEKHYGIPGIGGSLGKCALCGKNFLTEILLNKPVQSFTVGGVKQIMYGHDPCIEEFKKLIEPNGKITIENLPEGPLKDALTRM